MRTIYGTLAPLRRLEDIISLKRHEKELAGILRAAVPGLEPEYGRWLAEWEAALDAAQRQAEERLRHAISARLDGDRKDADDWDAVSALWKSALRQSGEFARQLGLLPQFSLAAREAAVFPALLEAVRQGCARHETDEGPIDGLDGGLNDTLRPESADEPAPEREEDSRPLMPEGAWSDPLAGGSGAWGANPAASVPIGGHKLPPLPYPYDALEPWIDERTMRIHHDKHHQSYVDGLNNAEKKLAEARLSGDFSLVKHWERELAFHGAGHYLHTIFWQAMKPGGGGRPGGALAAEIDRSFGGFEAFQKQFSEAARNVEGGGWAILVWSPRSRRLEILTAEKHQNLSQWDVIPLLPLDVWEHAYYLKHQNDRAAYIRDWWNVVNWPYVAERYAEARKVQWTPY